MRLQRVLGVLLMLAAAGVAAAAPEAERMLDLINRIRAEYGLQPVQLEPRLTEAAEAHSRDMARHDLFAHRGSAGDTLRNRLDRVGYAFRTAAENIAAGQETAAQTVESWMSSPGHRHNILMPELREIGVGHVRAPQGGGGPRFGDYWTLVLAAPMR